MKKGYMMRYVAYYRVSTQEQGRSGLGLAAQEQAVRAHVRARGAELVAEFTEVESGRNADRPQLKRARALAIKSKATLLIAKLDRLARSVNFISALMMDRGLEIEACDLPAANRMTLHIMAAVAEGEAAAISARTKAALAQAARQGKKFGFAHERNRANAVRASAAGVESQKLAADRYAQVQGAMIENYRRQGLTFAQIAEQFTWLRIPMARQRETLDDRVWTVGRVYQIYRRYSFIGPRQHGRVALPPPCAAAAA